MWPLSAISDKLSKMIGDRGEQDEGQELAPENLLSFTRRSHCVDVPHVRQLFHWDCGLACVLMVLRTLGIDRYDIHDLKKLCCTTSIWTVDLAYLLHKFSVDFSFFTVTVGVNPNYSAETFYRRRQVVLDKSELDFLGNIPGLRLLSSDGWSTPFEVLTENGHLLPAWTKEQHLFPFSSITNVILWVRLEQVQEQLQDDIVRVDELFAKALQAGISIQSRSIRAEDIAVLLLSGHCIAVALIDKTKLSRSWMNDTDATECCSGWSDYMGHYVVICGYDADTCEFEIRDPAISRKHERVSMDCLDEARKSFGTDEDILLVSLNGKDGQKISSRLLM